MSNPSASTHADTESPVYEGFEQDLRSLHPASLMDLLQSIAVETVKKSLSKEFSNYFTKCLAEHPISFATPSELVDIPSPDEAVLSVYLSLQQDLRSLPKKRLKDVLQSIAVEVKERDLIGEFSNYFNDCLNELEEVPISSSAASIAITSPLIRAGAAPFAGGAASASAGAAADGSVCPHSLDCTWHLNQGACKHAFHPGWNKEAAQEAKRRSMANKAGATVPMCRFDGRCANGGCRFRHSQ